MRGGQLTYPNVYDAAARIMDLNFNYNFKSRYMISIGRLVPMARDLIS